MADMSSIMIYVLVASLIGYVAIAVKKSSQNYAEEIKIKLLEKIAQYFASSQSLEKALRQIVAEMPNATSDYAKIIQKIDSGLDIENAISQAANEIGDDFFSKMCDMLIAANRKNDAGLLFNSVQKIEEASELQHKISSGAGIVSWTFQFVFVIIMPLIYFFMAGMLGFTADIYLNAFLIVIVVCSALVQGVVFKQWI